MTSVAIPQSSPSSLPSLTGMVFCITGRLSIVRRDVQNLLRENGGSVRTSVTREVTHLICADYILNDPFTKKAIKGENEGVQFMSESQLYALIGTNNDEENSFGDVVGFAPSTPTTTPVAFSSGTKKRGHHEVITIIDDDDDDDEVCEVIDVIDSSSSSFPQQKRAKKANIGKPKTTTTAVTTTTKEIMNGESVEVAGGKYIVKNIGGVYSCNCPAWRFQKLKIDERTCKHIQEYCGEEAERERLGETNSNSSSSSTVSKAASTSSTAAKASSSAATQGKELFLGSNLMLAHSWNAGKHQPEGFLMSEKLDGMRALWNGTNLVSRNGNIIDAPQFFIEGFPTDIALDGELFAGRGLFQKTVSIARRKNGGDLWSSLTYVVFDAPNVPGGFETRLEKAKNATEGLTFVRIHQHSPCRDLDHLNEELARIEGLGGEGVMMRLKNSPYKFGRSNDLLKVKTFKDDEAIVYEHQKGKGRHNGRIGALLCRLRNGKTFKVGSGFSDSQREHQNAPQIGSIITFRYFEMTKDGNPRFPVFVRERKDVDASEFD